MLRPSRFLLVAFLGCLTVPATTVAQTRVWDDGGVTKNWSEASNWSPSLLPGVTTDVEIGSLASAFDDTVILDQTTGFSKSVTLENGADLDTNGNRLFVSGALSIGNTFSGTSSGSSETELIVRPTSEQNSVDADTIVVQNAQIKMLGGTLEVDGTSDPGILDLARSGKLLGYGTINLTDDTANFPLRLGGEFTVGDPNFSTPGVEPPAVSLEINAPPTGKVSASTNASATVSRNATLALNVAAIENNELGFDFSLHLEANSRLHLNGKLALAESSSSSLAVRINSGASNPGTSNELPARPAILSGDRLLDSGLFANGPNELIVESTLLATSSLGFFNQGVVRFEGGGELGDATLSSFAGGFMVNGSESPLLFLAGAEYETPWVNEGLLAIQADGANRTVELESFTQQEAGALQIQIDSIFPGELDTVDVAGNAILGGTLAVDFLGAFTPVVGNTFEILTTEFGNVGGTFDDFDIPVFDGMTLRPIYNPKSVVLEVVPAPASADLDGDGDVDGADFLAIQRDDPALIGLWQTQYGSSGALAAIHAIPEPGTLNLAMTTVLLGLVRRQQR